MVPAGRRGGRRTIPRSSSGCAASRPATPATRGAASSSSPCPTTRSSRSRAPGGSSSSASGAAGCRSPTICTRSPPPRRASCSPRWRPVHGAIYSRGAARVDGRLLNRALRTAAEARGLVVRAGGVERLMREGDAVQGVVVGGETVRGRRRGHRRRRVVGRRSASSSASPSRWRRSAGRSSTSACAAPTPAAGPWSARSTITTWSRGRTAAWSPAPRARRAPASRRTRRRPACARCWARRCAWRRGSPTPRFARSAWGCARSPPTRCRCSAPCPASRGVFLVTGHGPTGLTLGPYSAQGRGRARCSARRRRRTWRRSRSRASDLRAVARLTRSLPAARIAPLTEVHS